MSTPPILRRRTSGTSGHHPRGRRHKEVSAWVDGITDLRVAAIEAFHERGIFRETTTRHGCGRQGDKRPHGRPGWQDRAGRASPQGNGEGTATRVCAYRGPAVRLPEQANSDRFR